MLESYFRRKITALIQKATLLAILGGIVCAQDLRGQDKREVVNQPVEWFSASSIIKFHKKAGLFVEGHARFVQALEPMQFQIRTALDVEINERWSVYPIGYVYTWNPLYGKQPNTYVNNEHRTFQQVMFKHQISKAAVSHRLRTEQRFTEVHSVENGEVVNKGYDLYTNRLRYRFNANIPLNGEKIEVGTLYAVVYDELFLSFGKNVTYREPDQNRIFTGLGYSFSKKFSLQGGPFYQLLIKSGGSKQENNIGMAFHASYNFDLTMK